MTDEAREQSDETVPYRVICISLYHEDIARLDALVKALKRRKVRGVSRSSVIRAALDRIDVKSFGEVLR